MSSSEAVVKRRLWYVFRLLVIPLIVYVVINAALKRYSSSGSNSAFVAVLAAAIAMWLIYIMHQSRTESPLEDWQLNIKIVPENNHVPVNLLDRVRPLLIRNIPEEKFELAPTRHKRGKGGAALPKSPVLEQTSQTGSADWFEDKINWISHQRAFVSVPWIILFLLAGLGCFYVAARYGTIHIHNPLGWIQDQLWKLFHPHESRKHQPPIKLRIGDKVYVNPSLRIPWGLTVLVGAVLTVIFVWRWMIWYYSVIVITNMHLILAFVPPAILPFLGESNFNVPLGDVEPQQFKQSLSGRLLGGRWGTSGEDTAAQDDKPIGWMKNVPHAKKFNRVFRSAQGTARNVLHAPAPAPVTT
jgi:hypothetical protein